MSTKQQKISKILESMITLFTAVLTTPGKDKVRVSRIVETINGDEFKNSISELLQDVVVDRKSKEKKLKDPATLVFAYTPVEDPAVYESVFRPFTDYLGKCTAKRVVFYDTLLSQLSPAEVDAAARACVGRCGMVSRPHSAQGFRCPVARTDHLRWRRGPLSAGSDFGCLRFLGLWL